MYIFTFEHKHCKTLHNILANSLEEAQKALNKTLWVLIDVDKS